MELALVGLKRRAELATLAKLAILTEFGLSLRLSVTYLLKVSTNYTSYRPIGELFGILFFGSVNGVSYHNCSSTYQIILSFVVNAWQ